MNYLVTTMTDWKEEKHATRANSKEEARAQFKDVVRVVKIITPVFDPSEQEQDEEREEAFFDLMESTGIIQ